MKLRLAVRFVAVGIIVALVLLHSAVHLFQTDQPVGYLLVSADGRTLAGTIPQCASGRLEAEETDDVVAVSSPQETTVGGTTPTPC